MDELKKKVADLDKINKLKQEIKKLEEDVKTLESGGTLPVYHTFPSVQFCQHDYNHPFGGLVWPRKCNKCGQSENNWTSPTSPIWVTTNTTKFGNIDIIGDSSLKDNEAWFLQEGRIPKGSIII